MITHIVAIDKNNCIGKNNQLAWHVPADLKHFKELTTGKTVLMGRNTFDSIGKELPNRKNLIVSRSGLSLDEALRHDDIFIIGGAEIYKQTIDIADKLIITKLDLTVDSGDVFYPDIPSRFNLIESKKMTCDKSGINFELLTYVKFP